MSRLRAPAQSGEDIVTVRAITTSEGRETDIRESGTDSAGGTVSVGGITGTLATGCYRNDAPAAVLIVHADP